MQLCSLCEEHDDIVLLKVDWDQNKPIARPLGVKVGVTAHIAQSKLHVLCFAYVWLHS